MVQGASSDAPPSVDEQAVRAGSHGTGAGWSTADGAGAAGDDGVHAMRRLGLGLEAGAAAAAGRRSGATSPWPGELPPTPLLSLGSPLSPLSPPPAAAGLAAPAAPPAAAAGVAPPSAIDITIAFAAAAAARGQARGGVKPAAAAAAPGGGAEEEEDSPDAARPLPLADDNNNDDGSTDPEAYERAHVHGVYEAIAPHFSATRHKPWPLVAEFLRAQPPGSVGLDVGCGNGKYLGAAPDGVVVVGCDRSPALVALARGNRGGAAGSGGADGSTAAAAKAEANEVLVADGLALPFRAAAADFAISVAVVHHLSTRPRRRDAIRELLACVRRPGGTALVYVWALEQGGSRRGWDEGGEQDLLVPWVMKAAQDQPQQQQKKKNKKEKKQKKGRKASKRARARSEQGADGEGGGVEEEEAAEDDDENTAVQQHKSEAAVAPAATAADGDEGKVERSPDKTFQRYYHLYRKGELEEDAEAAGAEVLRSGYEKDNWWVIIGHGGASRQQ